MRPLGVGSIRYEYEYEEHFLKQSNQQLTGLSIEAISRWCSVIGLDRSSTVNRLLIALAENCQRLSDRSNETFTPISKADSEQIESQLVDLEREIARCM
jgi:hypothetical protein